MAQSPRFLHRKSYRLRRLMDAVRLLPFLGIVLWALPLLWPVGGDGGGGDAVRPVSTGSALLYIFGVWLGLAVVAWLLWRKTRDLTDVEGEAETQAPAESEAGSQPGFRE